MTQLTFSSFVLCALACCGPVANAFAHGGQYRGPGCVVPPAAGNAPGGGGFGGGAGSSGPGSTTPSAAGQASRGTAATATSGAAAGIGPGAAGRGIQLTSDLTAWEFWWEFGKDPFLQLRESVRGGRAIAAEDALLNPRLAARMQRVELPTLADRAGVADRIVRTLRHDDNRDVASAGLIALAKIGIDGKGWRLREVVLPFLASHTQEVRETAALALGIAGQLDDPTLGALSALAHDTAPGRELSGERAVNLRTRSFAVFGLGLLLQQSANAGYAAEIVDELVRALHGEDAGFDLPVAAIEALGLLPRGPRTHAHAKLRQRVLTTLTDYYGRDLGPGQELVQAHVPPAIARLVAPGDREAARFRARFAADLGASLAGSSRARKTNVHIAQSCALALGGLTPPWGEDGDSDPVGRLLLQVYRDHKDEQTRRFALVAIARIGGPVARDVLLRELDRAGKALELPWVGLALGALVTPERLRQGANYQVDAEIAERLRSAFAAARNPSAKAALAMALALVGDDFAADPIRRELEERKHQRGLAGYLAVALGMLRDDLATPVVRDVLKSSRRRAATVFHCAQALGLLGDPRVVDLLCAELTAENPPLAQLAAAASALGQIGDRRSIASLLELLERDDVTPLARAFAIVGLGSVCDPRVLPWNTAYATECNYRASTSTLTDGRAGILDIL